MQPDAVPGGGRTPDAAADDAGAAHDLATTIYSTLRAIAQRQMLGERRAHTLTATALVHEAYLKLAGSEAAGLPRRQYFQTAAQAMRRILIDHARKRKAEKRGAGAAHACDMENVVDLAVHGDPDEILALDEAILRLEGEDADAAGVVRLRFFAGLSGDEAAEVLGISPRQIDREWAYARAYLFKQLGGRSGEG